MYYFPQEKIKIKFFFFEKVLFITCSSPFLSEKCMKRLEIFKAHVKKYRLSQWDPLSNLDSRLFIDI